MYGGDEVGAIVVDVGSVSSKIGFAGEDAPKLVVPTVAAARAAPAADQDGDAAMAPAGLPAAASVAARDARMKERMGRAPRYHVGQPALYRREGVELSYPVQHGLVADWDAMEELWYHMFVDQLSVDPAEHPVMVAEPEYNTIEHRERTLEMAFERFGHPAAFLGRAPVLAAFSVGKATAVVLDCGGGHSSAVPVHDGFVLNRAAHKTKVAGQVADELLDAMLFELNPKTRGVVPHPRYKVRRRVGADGAAKAELLDLPGTTASYHRHMRMDLLRDIKESVCRVAEEPFDVDLNRSIPPIAYDLPDGNQVWLGTDRFMAGEKLFVPADFELKDDLDAARGYRFGGMSRLVTDCIEACDVDLRRDLFANVVITGGTSLLPGFQERLARDLNEACPSGLKAKVISPATQLERQFGVWIGGSILASLGSFHQMWLSKAEYEEHGMRVLARKCP